MKKTHIIATLLFALPLVVLTSCLKDDKDVFDESASTRMQEQLTNTRKILMGAKDGWVMDYYYGDDQANGSKVFIIKFDSLECTAMSEFTGDKSSTSYYKLTNDNGPVLTFDTYNDVLHNLATPSSTDYEGQHADFEMVVMSATPERVVLKGKKTNDYMYLYPLSGSATDYIANVTAMSENLIVGTAVGKTVDGDSIVGTFNTDSRYITFTNASDTSFHKKVPYTYTDKGLRLYEDVQLGSTTVSSFVYDEENSTLTSNNFKFECRMPEGWMPYADFAGSYKLYCDDGETQTTYDVSLVPQADGKTYQIGRAHV